MFEGLAMPRSAVCCSLGLRLSNTNNNCEGTGFSGLHIRSGLLMQQNGAVTLPETALGGFLLPAGLWETRSRWAPVVRLAVQLWDDFASTCDSN